MQFLRNAVFSAPTSFLALASFRHAVRLACLAAASPGGGAAAGGLVGVAAAPGAAVPGVAVPGVAVPGVAVPGTSARSTGGAANTPATGRQKHTAAATVRKQGLMESRIALTHNRTDEARMKLA
jgi:hypothetical protein